jgi:hypothetical protein
MVSVKSAEISPENLVIRFSESVDGFPLPKGHSQNPELVAPQKPGAEAFLKEVNDCFLMHFVNQWK